MLRTELWSSVRTTDTPGCFTVSPVAFALLLILVEDPGCWYRIRMYVFVMFLFPQEFY